MQKQIIQRPPVGDLRAARGIEQRVGLPLEVGMRVIEIPRKQLYGARIVIRHGKRPMIAQRFLIGATRLGLTRIVDHVPRICGSRSRLQRHRAVEHAAQLLRPVAGAHGNAGEPRRGTLAGSGEPSHKLGQRHQ